MEDVLFLNFSEECFLGLSAEVHPLSNGGSAQKLVLRHLYSFLKIM